MEKLIAIFAGGCFWCLQPLLDGQEGVVKVEMGYTGGHKVNPSYEEVCGGGSGHLEAVRITYDPKKVSYQQLLEIYWKNIDPTDGGGQFCDRGEQYRSAIFYLDEEQKKLAQESLSKLPLEKVYTEIRPASAFYPAEEYHQDYYLKHPYKYKFYRYNCGRDQRLEEIWEK